MVSAYITVAPRSIILQPVGFRVYPGCFTMHVSHSRRISEMFVPFRDEASV